MITTQAGCITIPPHYVKKYTTMQGRPQDLAGGGGVQEIFFRFGNLHVAKPCALIEGHAPPRNFFKMVQFGAFWCIFESDFVLNFFLNYHLLYKKLCKNTY